MAEENTGPVCARMGGKGRWSKTFVRKDVLEADSSLTFLTKLERVKKNVREQEKTRLHQLLGLFIEDHETFVSKIGM